MSEEQTRLVNAATERLESGRYRLGWNELTPQQVAERRAYEARWWESRQDEASLSR